MRLDLSADGVEESPRVSPLPPPFPVSEIRVLRERDSVTDLIDRPVTQTESCSCSWRAARVRVQWAESGERAETVLTVVEEWYERMSV